MGSFTRDEFVVHGNVFFHVVAISSIFYLLVRHLLLEKSKVEPAALGCGQCTKACLGWCKELVGQTPSDSQIRKVKVVSPRIADDETFFTNVVEYCTYGSLLLYLIDVMVVCTIFTSQAGTGWLPFAFCQNAIKTAATLTISAKCCMYAVFVARLHLGFKGSAYAYSKRVIYSLFAAIIVIYLVFIPMTIVFYRGKRKEANGSVNDCIVKAPPFYYPFPLCFDVIFTVTVVHLFANALNKMLRNFTRNMSAHSRAHEKITQADLYLLPLKYSVLSTVAILSTFMAFGLSVATGVHFLLPLDCAVNCAMLVLMTAKWKPLYVILCTPILKCVAHAPCLPCADPSHAELIETITQQNALARNAVFDSKSDQSSGVSLETLE